MNSDFQNQDNNDNINSENTQSEYSESKVNHISYTPTNDGIYSYSMNESAVSATPVKKNIAIAFLLLFASIFLITIGVLFGFTLNSFVKSGNAYSESYPDNGTVNIVGNRPAIETKPINYSDRNLLSIPDIASGVASSVVEIKTESAQYNHFYGMYVSEGAGSGVIITDTGFIITNNHVIDGASSITVKLSNGNEYPASVVGADSESDIAVISITPRENLNPAYLGKSDVLLLGESVVVIGNPLGSLGGSVTNGIISALDREIVIDGETMTLIQTNAAVNPGNSGGGMFNMYGELVGIINAKSSGENIEGIGFAIPIDYAYAIACQLIENGYVKGKVDHGFTLIEISDVWDMAKYNVSSTGVYIYESKFSAEFKNGDRIQSINDVEIKSLSDIKSALKNFKVGDSVNIRVYRGKRLVSSSLVLGEYIPEK